MQIKQYKHVTSPENSAAIWGVLQKCTTQKILTLQVAILQKSRDG